MTRPIAEHDVSDLIEEGDTSLLDLVDHLLNQGVVLDVELVLGLADIDLVYVRLSALLCAADRLLGEGGQDDGQDGEEGTGDAGGDRVG